MNILVTSVGSFSGRSVIDALSNSGHRVIGIDINPREHLSTICMTCGFYQVPHSRDAEGYLGRLIDIIRKEAVDAVIALTDPEVDLLSERNSFFDDAGVALLMPNRRQVSLARDKNKMAQLMSDGGVRTIPTYETLNSALELVGFPIIAKQRKGRSSIGLRRLDSSDDISPSLTAAEGRYVFQPHLNGDIVTVDIVNDIANGTFYYMPRLEYIRTANGAGLTVEVFKDCSLTPIVKRLCEISGLRGCFNVEFIKNNEGYHLMDINPRFSAGIGFSLSSGYDFINNHISCFFGEEIDNGNVYRTGIYTRGIYDIAFLGDH